MSTILRAIPEYADFEKLRGSLMEWMECAPSSDEHAAWIAYSGGGIQKMRARIADEYRMFDLRHKEWIEQTQEDAGDELEPDQEQDELDKARDDYEMRKEDIYYDRLLADLSSPRVFEDIGTDDEEDEGNELGDSQNEADKSFMRGFAFEPDDSNDMDFSPLVDESNAPDEKEPEPPFFSAEDWKRGRDLLWKMRTTHPVSRQLLLMEADWLRLALLNQNELHVFHSKAAFGKAMLREIEIQSFVDAA